MTQQDAATDKAKDLVRMGVAKVSLLSPEEDLSTEVPAIIAHHWRRDLGAFRRPHLSKSGLPC